MGCWARREHIAISRKKRVRIAIGRNVPVPGTAGPYSLSAELQSRAARGEAGRSCSGCALTVRSGGNGGSDEVPNRCLERHCVDCRLPCALHLRSQRFDHVEIASLYVQSISRSEPVFCNNVGRRHGARWHACCTQPSYLVTFRSVALSVLYQSLFRESRDLHI